MISQEINYNLHFDAFFVINVIDIVFFTALIYSKNLPACILILGALFSHLTNPAGG